MKNNLFKTDNKLSLSIYFLFFLSGFNSLVIQIISIYSLGIVLGNTAYSMSVVVTAFMLGLALGSCLAERMIHKNVEFFKRWNILIYGVVTLLVGLYSCKIIPLIILKNDFFLSLTTASKKVLPLIINHFFVSFGLLAVPTIGMGLTFPVLALSMKTRKDNSVLYAVNTGGAAAGSIVTGFFLIKYLGVLQSLYLVFLSGLFVFFCALLIIIFYRRSSLLASAPVKEPSVLIKGQHSLTVGELYLFSFLSGFIFLSYEMLFNRIFSLVLGNRIYVSSITLFLVLAGITYGALRVKKLLSLYSPERLITFCYSVSMIMIAVMMILFFFLFDPVDYSGSFVAVALYCAGLLPVAMALGMIFPLILSIRPGPDDPATTYKGKYIGYLYAINTAGSLLGPLITTYILMRTIGTFYSFAFMGLITFLPILFIHKREILWKKNIIAHLALGLNLLFLLFYSSRSLPEKIIVEREDEYGRFRIVKIKEDVFAVFNNCTQLVFYCGLPVTQYVQEMQAHFPLLYTERPEKILNIGTGYGITAGAFTLYEGVRRIDTVEIIPLMIKYASLFSNHNYKYYDHPLVRVHITDGRQFLSRSAKTYDIISINISDPYLYGNSSLFSDEFYRIVKSHLNRGGVVCQHIFGPDRVSLIHQFKAHFPYVRIIPAYKNGVNIIGSEEPLPSRPLWRNIDLGHIGLKNREQFTRLVSRGERLLETYLSQKPSFVQTDIRPVLEYRIIPNKMGILFSNI